MPALKRPGVFLEERPPLTIPPAGTISTSTGAFIGADTRGPVTPTLVNSYSEFARLFNDVSTPGAGELPFQVYSFFANGGSRAYVARVAGSGAAVATRTLTDRAGTPLATLVVNAANPGTWGNNLYVDINDNAAAGLFDVLVYFGGTSNAYLVERFTGLSMDATSTNYALTVVNNTEVGSKYIQLAQPTTPSITAAPNNAPSAQVSRQLTNGTNGAAVADSDFSTALSRFDNVLEPVNLTLPGATGGQQSLAVSYAEARGDIFVVCSLDTSITTTSAAITAASALTASSYGAVYWPSIIVANPASTVPGATRVQSPAGAVLGLIALTDATRGIQKAPAGTSARVAGALGTNVNLTSANLDDLNVAQVNAIRLVPGSGVVVMGARTLKQGSSDRYVPIRRVLIYVKSNVINLSQFVVFEPNTSKTREALTLTLERFLRDSWNRGLLKGASPRAGVLRPVRQLQQRHHVGQPGHRQRRGGRQPDHPGRVHRHQDRSVRGRHVRHGRVR